MLPFAMDLHISTVKEAEEQAVLTIPPLMDEDLTGVGGGPQIVVRGRQMHSVVQKATVEQDRGNRIRILDNGHLPT